MIPPRLPSEGSQRPGFPSSLVWSLASLFALGLAWWIAARELPAIILPGLGATVIALGRLLGEPETFTALGESLTTFVFGLLIAAVLGGALGLLSGLSQAARAALAPLIAILNAVPSVAWMGLAMIWFGLGAGPTVFLVVVTSAPILAAALQQAVRDRDPRFDELADVFELPRAARLRHVTAPPLLSSARGALLAMAGLGWKLTVMGEFLTASRGLGEQLVIAKAHMQTDRVIAITVVLVCTWVLIEGAMRLLAKFRSLVVRRAGNTSRTRPLATRCAGEARAEQTPAPSPPAAIACREVSLAHGGRIIAEQLSFSAIPGSVTAILGASGIGKSSLLRVLGGGAQPALGTIERSPGARTSWVFQEDRLLPWRTLEQNVSLFVRVPASAALTQLTDLGLEDAVDRQPAELSGGMRQRGALARAFLRESNLLLLDEPFAGLDVRRRRALIHDLQRMQREHPRTIIFVTHDVDDALALADRALVLGGAPTARITAQVDLSHLGPDRALDDPALAAPRRTLLTALLECPHARPGLSTHRSHSHSGVPHTCEQCQPASARAPAPAPTPAPTSSATPDSPASPIQLSESSHR